MIVDLATHDRKYVTVPDLIRYCGVPRQTVYWHVKNEKLPVVRFGRMLRVLTVAARDWFDVYVRPVQH